MRMMKKHAENFASHGNYVDEDKTVDKNNAADKGKARGKARGNSDDQGNGSLEGQSGEKMPPKDLGPLIASYLGISSYNDPVHSLDFTRDRYNVSGSADLTSFLFIRGLKTTQAPDYLIHAGTSAHASRKKRRLLYH